MQQELILRSMGYRPQKEGSWWCKPFGYSILLFEVEKQEIGQYFYDDHDSILCWKREVFDPNGWAGGAIKRDPFLWFLTNFEN
jgi:hypothetical protein